MKNTVLFTEGTKVGILELLVMVTPISFNFSSFLIIPLEIQAKWIREIIKYNKDISFYHQDLYSSDVPIVCIKGVYNQY